MQPITIYFILHNINFMNIYVYRISILLLVFLQNMVFGQNSPPVVRASGNQAYCPLDAIPVATSFTISDIDDDSITSFSVQISKNYNENSDILRLNSVFPGILTVWNKREGKLTLRGVSGKKISLVDLETIVKSVEFQSSDVNIFQERLFSLTVGTANYLPSTQHYYEFIPDTGIQWTQAKILAENSTYFGLRGYLTTITSLEEAIFVGEQSSGTGWIGGSDQGTDGIWKWETGPEAGTVFWNGSISGSSPNFAYWNSGEPNNYGGQESYAHVTDDSIGIQGSWNDLEDIGGSGPYEPKGYVVEYGGWPDDPKLEIAATTRIYVPEIITTIGDSICGPGTVTLTAYATEGDILWYDRATGGNPIGFGQRFTIPSLLNSQTFYVTTSVSGCTNIPRKEVTASVLTLPTILRTKDGVVCGNSGNTTLEATANEGTVYWYDSLTSADPIFIGESYEVFINANTTYYVEAVNQNGCKAPGRTAIHANFDTNIPNFEVADTIVLCLNNEGVAIEINNPLSNDYRYEWTDELDTVISTQKTATISSPGLYFVKATAISGCSSETKRIRVTASELASVAISNIRVFDASDTNSIEILMDSLGIGNYEFSLNDNDYQDAPVFSNLAPGIYTLYVRDKNGCGTVTFPFSVFNYPSFFTPNNDGIKDRFIVDGLDTEVYTTYKIQIFNRYGKIVFESSDMQQAWDGTYNSRKLPSNTYWYYVEIKDLNGNLIKRSGPVSLLRK